MNQLRYPKRSTPSIFKDIKEECEPLNEYQENTHKYLNSMRKINTNIKKKSRKELQIVKVSHIKIVQMKQRITLYENSHLYKESRREKKDYLGLKKLQMNNFVRSLTAIPHIPGPNFCLDQVLINLELTSTLILYNHKEKQVYKVLRKLDKYVFSIEQYIIAGNSVSETRH